MCKQRPWVILIVVNFTLFLSTKILDSLLAEASSSSRSQHRRVSTIATHLLRQASDNSRQSRLSPGPGAGAGAGRRRGSTEEQDKEKMQKIIQMLQKKTQKEFTWDSVVKRQTEETRRDR